MRALSAFSLALVLIAAVAPPSIPWKTGDRSRPLPPRVTANPGAPPSDAVVLFDGKSLDAWQQASGKPAAWKVGGGSFEVAPGSGDLVTKRPFGDCQLHIGVGVLLHRPARAKTRDAATTASDLMGTDYEIQVLDSYDNKTYPEGQCAAVYNQDAADGERLTRKPGEWQSYDIVFARTALRTRRRAAPHRAAHLAAQRRAGAGSYGADRPHRLHEAPALSRRTRRSCPFCCRITGSRYGSRNIWIRELAP